MSLSNAVRLGSQRPRIESRPQASSNAAREAVQLAEDAGLILDEWQQNALEIALGETPDGKWAAFEVGLIVPRQNGKGGVLEARELAGLFLFGERLILHSAHEFKTAKEAFYRMEPLIMGCPKLARRVKQVRRSSEEVGFELTNGARLRYIARKSGTGRGFTGDCVILDEAFNLDATVMGAVLPTLSARPNPQLWYTSSAPMATSTQLHSVRRRAIEGGSSRLAYAEWSRDPELDRSDPRAWAQANPAMGIRIAEEFIVSEIEALPPEEFNRERLGDPDPEVSARAVFADGKWQAVLMPGASPAGAQFIGVDANPERSLFSVAVAGGGVVEVIDPRPTSVNVLVLLDKLARELGAPVAFDPSGPAGFLKPELERLGIGMLEVSGVKMGQACGALFTAVNDGAIKVRPSADLNQAVAGARTQPRSDAWVWARKDGTVDVSPLVAVTLAWWAAAQAVPVTGDYFAVFL